MLRPCPCPDPSRSPLSQGLMNYVHEPHRAGFHEDVTVLAPLRSATIGQVGEVAPTFGVLGALEVCRDGVPVPLPGGAGRPPGPRGPAGPGGCARRCRVGGRPASRPQAGAAHCAVPAARRPGRRSAAHRASRLPPRRRARRARRGPVRSAPRPGSRDAGRASRGAARRSARPVAGSRLCRVRRPRVRPARSRPAGRTAAGHGGGPRRAVAGTRRGHAGGHHAGCPPCRASVARAGPRPAHDRALPRGPAHRSAGALPRLPHAPGRRTRPRPVTGAARPAGPHPRPQPARSAAASGRTPPAAPPPARRQVPAAAAWLIASPAFVGRDDDTAALLDAVGTHRLVTVTGTGGVGKTRLVAEALGSLTERYGLPVTV